MAQPQNPGSKVLLMEVGLKSPLLNAGDAGPDVQTSGSLLFPSRFSASSLTRSSFLFPRHHDDRNEDDVAGIQVVMKMMRG